MTTTDQTKDKDNLAIEAIGKIVKTPGIKVERDDFLAKTFAPTNPDLLDSIIEQGPIAAGIDQTTIRKMAKGLVNKRTLESSGASFAAGIPGGIAMAGTIPADLIQFYAFALRLAQEIAYLYGMDDLWDEDNAESEEVFNTLLVYLGVMLGVSGASATLKAMASALSKQALKKLPQKALTKTAYYPLIKSIAKFFGKKMTKDIFASGVSKTIPFIGGFASGGLTLATMRPMGMRLVNCLDEACFDYTEDDLKNDIIEIEEVVTAEMMQESPEHPEPESAVSELEREIAKAKAMLDKGLVTEEEFAEIKTRLIAKL